MQLLARDSVLEFFPRIVEECPRLHLLGLSGVCVPAQENLL